MDEDVNKMKLFTKKTNNKAPLVLEQPVGLILDWIRLVSLLAFWQQYSGKFGQNSNMILSLAWAYYLLESLTRGTVVWFRQKKKLVSNNGTTCYTLYCKCVNITSFNKSQIWNANTLNFIILYTKVFRHFNAEGFCSWFRPYEIFVYILGSTIYVYIHHVCNDGILAIFMWCDMFFKALILIR